jgi:hypothetical protein
VTSPRRLAARSLLASACALLVGGATATAAKAPVAVGDYAAIPKLETGGAYTEGAFSVAKEPGKRTIVAREELDGIYYPDVGKCDDQQIPLVADTIPISSTARFKIRDKTELDATAIVVVWKGHWTKAKKIAGTITIKSGDCSSTNAWTARKVG